MAYGYVKIYRSIQDNPIYLSEPFTKAQAWIDLIMLANYKDAVIFVKGKDIQLKRGQLCWSEAGLSVRWKWGRPRVDKFLSYLQKVGQIVLQKSNLTSCITIINYDRYQGDDTADDTGGITSVVPQTLQVSCTDNKVKERTNKVKKENNNEQLFILPDWINPVVWAAYVEMRTKLKAPLTQHAMKLCIGKLEAFSADGYDPNEILNAAIEHSWKGVWLPKNITKITAKATLQEPFKQQAAELEDLRSRQNCAAEAPSEKLRPCKDCPERKAFECFCDPAQACKYE